MNRSELIALYNQDQRLDVEYPDMRREVTPRVVRHVDLTDHRQSFVVHSQLSEAIAEDVIREQVEYFESIGQDFEWKFYDYDQPADLLERLRSYGFEIEESEAIMVLDLEQAPVVLWQPVVPEIMRIVTPDDLSDVLAVEEQVWDDDFTWLGDYLGRALTRFPEQMSVYAARVEGKPVSSAWIYFPKHSRFASLWGGSTLRDYRGRGLYTALLAVRAQEARERQVRFLTVDASDMSRPILEKFGFEVIALSHPCKWRIKAA